jgi:hypothetical protein
MLQDWVRSRASSELSRFLILSCILLIVPATLQAQGDQQPDVPAQPSQAAAGQYKLSGSVTNAVTGEPIRRALVQLQGEFERSTLSDSNGQFEFTGLTATQVNVTARKPGFFGEEELDDGPAQMKSILVGAETPAVAVKLTPESVIYGRVEAPDGEPIEEIPIRVISSQIVDGRKRWSPRANAMTNEDGEFRVGNLPPGVYYVEAGPGASFRVRRARRLQLGEEGYTTAFYPGASDPTGASPIALSPGQQQEVHFGLKPQPVFKVSGLVRGYFPNSGVDLQIIDKIGEQMTVPIQFDPESGRFDTKVPAGDYTLRVRSQDAKQSNAADVPVSVTGNLSGVQVILGPAVSIPVTVQRQIAAQDSENHGGNRRGGEPVAVHLSSSESPFSSADFWSVPDPQKGLALHNVEPGKYAVDVVASSSWYVQSATCGSTDLLRDELVVPAGSQLPAIEIVLRDDGATLTGSVQSDGSPQKGVVVLVPDRGSAARAKIASAAQAGDFRFEHLAPGDYRLLAFDRVNDVEYRDPEVLNAYLSRGVHVSVQANGQSSTNVELIKVEK